MSPEPSCPYPLSPTPFPPSQSWAGGWQIQALLAVSQPPDGAAAKPKPPPVVQAQASEVRTGAGTPQLRLEGPEVSLWVPR